MSNPLFSSELFDKKEFDKWAQAGYPYQGHTDELWNEKTQSFGIFPETTQSTFSLKPATTKNGSNCTTTNNITKNGVVLY